MSEINKMMLEDSKDMLDNVEITDIATQCKLLKDISRPESSSHNC